MATQVSIERQDALDCRANRQVHQQKSARCGVVLMDNGGEVWLDDMAAHHRKGAAVFALISVSRFGLWLVRCLCPDDEGRPADAILEAYAGHYASIRPKITGARKAFPRS